MPTKLLPSVTTCTLTLILAQRSQFCYTVDRDSSTFLIFVYWVSPFHLFKVFTIEEHCINFSHKMITCLCYRLVTLHSNAWVGYKAVGRSWLLHKNGMSWGSIAL